MSSLSYSDTAVVVIDDDALPEVTSNADSGDVVPEVGFGEITIDLLYARFRFAEYSVAS